MFLPWSAFWPLAAPRLWQRIRARDAALLYCALWFAAFFLFFSFSRSKLTTYVLPLFPAAAVLTAAALVESWRAPARTAWEERAWKSAFALLGAAALLLPPLAAVGLWWFDERVLAHAALRTAGLLVPAVLVCAAVLRSRLSRSAAIAGLLAATVVAECGFYSFAAPALSARYSLRDAAQRLERAENVEEILAWRAVAHSLMFYTRRSVGRVSSEVELARALDNPKAVLLTKDPELQRLRCVLPRPVYVWWRGANEKVLVSSAPHPLGGSEEINPGASCPPR